MIRCLPAAPAETQVLVVLSSCCAGRLCKQLETDFDEASKSISVRSFKLQSYCIIIFIVYCTYQGVYPSASPRKSLEDPKETCKEALRGSSMGPFVPPRRLRTARCGTKYLVYRERIPLPRRYTFNFHISRSWLGRSHFFGPQMSLRKTFCTVVVQKVLRLSLASLG